MWQYVGHALQTFCMWNSSCELDRSDTRVTRLEARLPENYYLSLGEIGIIFFAVQTVSGPAQPAIQRA
jgi:hypothetical protein